MKFRTFVRRKLIRPLRNRLVAWTFPAALRALGWTLRVRWVGGFRREGSSLVPPGSGAVAAFWHHDIVGLAALCRSEDARVLISSHGDGRMIAEVAERLGLRTIAGSTTRGGSQAVLQLLRSRTRRFLVAITPDGPRGPRHDFQPGAVHLASKAAVPIYAFGIAYSRRVRLPTWDRLEVPLPFARALIMLGEPLDVPDDLDREARERLRLVAEERLRALADAGENDFERLWKTAVKFADLPTRTELQLGADEKPTEASSAREGEPTG